MGDTPVLRQIWSYAHGDVSYPELRRWIATHTPPDPDQVSAEQAERYRRLCGCELPRQADVGRQLSDAEIDGLLTEHEAADLYDAWSNP
jgi:hypothetical protein